ncbi:MAG: hypothetical protein ACYCVN_01020 [Acidimicrobiales bacterium]
MSDPSFVAGLRPIPATLPAARDRSRLSVDVGGSGGRPASDLIGTTTTGQPVHCSLVSEGPGVLLAFLAMRCDGCSTFWNGLEEAARHLAARDVSVVVVTRGPGTVDAAAVDALAGGSGSAVVMSDKAWSDYRVLGYPFFVLVDTERRIVIGESVALGWSEVVSMVADALPGDDDPLSP